MKTYFLPSILFIALIWACNPENEESTSINIDFEVNAVVVDHNNTKWVATNQGLYKSVNDGFEMVESIGEKSIEFLFYEENSKILWLGSNSGLSKVDLTLNEFSDQPVDNSNLSNQNIKCIHIDEDQKRWFGTEYGISLNVDNTWKNENFRVNFERTMFEMILEKYQVNSIASIDDDYFFATSGAKLFRAFDFDEEVDAFSGATQWDPPYNGQAITDTMFVVFVDNEGKKWMGGKVGIQTHVGDNPKDLQAIEYFNDELPDLYVLAINQAPDGKLWVGTRKGLAIYDGNNWEIRTNKLPSLYIKSIAFDKDGSAWIGTKEGLVNIQ